MLTAHKVRYLRPVSSIPESAHGRFVRLRLGYHAALLSWLREQPHPDDVAHEIDASVSVLRQLVHLVGRAS